MALRPTDPNKKLLGEFQERDHGKWFSYSLTTNEWAIAHGFVHEIDVQDGVRFACVRKTRVKVVVEEDCEGVPVVETWAIKSHNKFVVQE